MSNYPIVPTQPTGPLQSSDEDYQKTVLFTTSGQDTTLRNRHYNTSTCYFNDSVYYTYVDTSLRPKIVKASIDGSGTQEEYLDSGADYVVPDDAHYTFSITVDTGGYIHISGGMHNHRYNEASTNDNLPARYKTSTIMYWKSDNPQDISVFSFLGLAGDATIPTGYAFSYVQFHRDLNGVLYFKSRIYVRETGGHAEGEVGLGIYRYDYSTGNWTALGGLAPTTHGNVAIYKTVFWEDNGQWWQSQPVDHTLSFYQSIYNGLSFDLDNNMHFCYAINNITDNKNGTEVIYWKSTDGGDTFKKADGTTISAPVRASGSADTGDIVGANGRYSGDAWVDVDNEGNPVVAYNPYTDQSSANPNSPPKTRIFRSGAWEAEIDMQLNRIYGSGVGGGNDGILMYWALNNSVTQAELYRTYRYDQTGYITDVGGEMSGFDWTTFKKNGRLFLNVNDQVNQMLVMITFGNQTPIYEDCKKITQGAAYNCDFPIQPGMEPQIILINKKDILYPVITDNKITDIVMKSGKTGYLFEGKRQSSDASFERIDQGLTNGYAHNLKFQVFEIDSTQKNNLQGLAIGMTVGIVFNMNVPGNEDGYFEVFGMGAGMETETLTRINRDRESNASFSVSLKTAGFLSEAKTPMNFFDTDYDTTLNKILALLPTPGTGFPYTFPLTLS